MVQPGFNPWQPVLSSLLTTPEHCWGVGVELCVYVCVCLHMNVFNHKEKGIVKGSAWDEKVGKSYSVKSNI